MSVCTVFAANSAMLEMRSDSGNIRQIDNDNDMSKTTVTLLLPTTTTSNTSSSPLFSQVPFDNHLNDAFNSELQHHLLQLSASKLSAGAAQFSAGKNKRKNFQPRSIVIVDDDAADEEHHFSIKGDGDDAEEQMIDNDELDNDNEERIDEEEYDDLANGKSSGESCSSSTCDTNEIQQLRHHQRPGKQEAALASQHQEPIALSITGIRRQALQQRMTQQQQKSQSPSPSSTFSQSQFQPLDLSQSDSHTKTAVKSNEGNAIGGKSDRSSPSATSVGIANAINKLLMDHQGAKRMVSTTIPMDLSFKQELSNLNFKPDLTNFKQDLSLKQSASWIDNTLLPQGYNSANIGE